MPHISDYRITDRCPDRFDLSTLQQERQAVFAHFCGTHRHKAASEVLGGGVTDAKQIDLLRRPNPFAAARDR